jgi:hypothetical protein
MQLALAAITARLSLPTSGIAMTNVTPSIGDPIDRNAVTLATVTRRHNILFTEGKQWDGIL